MKISRENLARLINTCWPQCVFQVFKSDTNETLTVYESVETQKAWEAGQDVKRVQLTLTDEEVTLSK